MEKRKSSGQYVPEVRERTVRMVLENAGDHASQGEAIGSIAACRKFLALTARQAWWSTLPPPVRRDAMILNALVERLKRRSKDDFKGRHFEASLTLQASP